MFVVVIVGGCGIIDGVDRSGFVVGAPLNRLCKRFSISNGAYMNTQKKEDMNKWYPEITKEIG